MLREQLAASGRVAASPQRERTAESAMKKSGTHIRSKKKPSKQHVRDEQAEGNKVNAVLDQGRKSESQQEKAELSGSSSLFFRKLSNPDLTCSSGKISKLQHQFSEEDGKLRRGSFGGALGGKHLLPLSSSSGPLTCQVSGESSNLVRMRNQNLGQSAPSLTAGMVSPDYFDSHIGKIT
ncbi:hypothetical protein scyTo_0002910 [Scyliorhinus torazame]|uniref:Uncharacterized protein n=1 Tax=Scyliorhinus torazame TaxID=75743 RepID=A0A401PL53_SCYTO|nr:hypothetical protein [Scyliorhinus torazame]